MEARVHLLAIAVASGLLIGSAQAQDLGASWAVTGATLIDGTGVPPIASSIITGSGERITCVGRAESCPIPRDARIVEATGRWVIPGLIDTHIHPNPVDRKDETREQQLRRFAFGTTTARDAGTAGVLEENLAARQTARSAAVPEPRLLVSGLVSPANLTTYGRGNLRDLVRQLAALGVDAIKVKHKYDGEELALIISEAHAAGLPVFGHTYFGEDPQSYADTALQAGIDGLSHMETISAYSRRPGLRRSPVPEGLAYWIWLKQLWLYGDDERRDAAIDTIIGHRAWFEPTLVTEEHFTLPYPLPDDLVYLAKVPSLESTVRSWLPFGSQGFRASRERRAVIDSVFERICDFVARFYARGGMLVTGTDEEQAGAALIDEIRLLNRCGVPPQAALQAATANAASALRRDDIGTLQAGKLADFVLVDADPLRDLGHLRRVWRIVKGGYLHDPASLLAPAVDSYRAQVRATRAAWIAGSLLAFGTIVFGYRLVRSRSPISRRAGFAKGPLE